MQSFEKSNPDMARTLKSHLFPESMWADILNDNYQHFLEGRAARVSKELRKRVIPQTIDSEMQEVDANEPEEDSKIV